MAFTANTVPYKTVWINSYEETHYKQPIFPVFADSRFADSLPVGSTIKWTYDADIDAGALATDGTYNVATRTVTDESLTVNQLPYAAFRIPGPQKIQDHRPTQEKWATKSMNRIFWKMDAAMLGLMVQQAYSLVDASDPVAGSGAAASSTTVVSTPLTVSTANAPAIFAAARMKLRNANVIYDENKKWSGYVKLDTMAKYPCCAIPAELEAPLLLAIGFKPGDVGDAVLVKGFVNMLFGFNTFYSGTLPFTCTLTVAAGKNIADNDTLVIGGTSVYGTSGGLQFRFKTALASAGDVLIDGSNDYTTLANLVLALATPFADVGSTSKGFTRANGTIFQQQLGDNLSGSVQATTIQGAALATSKIMTLAVYGQGTVAVTTPVGTAVTVGNQAVHALFGTSQSVALVMQRYPELQVSPDIIGNGNNGGMVAKDFVTWTLAGWQVFKTHTYQLVDVPIACSTFTTPLNTYL